MTRAANPLADRARVAVRDAAEPCDYCRSPIVWTINGNTDNAMPLDAQPAEGGNVVVSVGVGPGRLLSAVLGTEAQRRTYAAAGHDLHLHHRLSCPRADEWARPGVARRGRYQAMADSRTPARRGRSRGRR